jgi:hypothetical protein
MQNKPLVFESACIFSIAGSSIGVVSMFISSLFFRFITEKITVITNITATEKLSPLYFALLGLAFCVSLLGAIKLYHMQRTGLYLYLAAQTLILFLPVFWIGNQAFSTINAFFTATFGGIYLYYFRTTK